MLNTIKEISSNVYALFFPNICSGCDEELVGNENVICTACWQNLPETNFHLVKNNSVEQMFLGRVLLENAFSLYFFNKDSRLQALLHALKYQNQTFVGILLGKQLGDRLLETSWWNSVDYIVPIPLSKEKQHFRGYNQSEFIAIGISKQSNIPVDNESVLRIKNTESQTKKKNKLERYENVLGAFKLINKLKFVNKHVLLVDDVLTTGATMEACVRIFNDVENCSVSVVSLAYAIEF